MRPCEEEEEEEEEEFNGRRAIAQEPLKVWNLLFPPKNRTLFFLLSL
jgi:hypothetical protein